jgi:hypothetical protein
MEGAGMLDQTMRQRRIRFAKNLLNAGIAVLMVVLIIVVFGHKGGSLSPTFLPLPAIILVVVLCGLLMNMVSIIFNAAEVAVVDTPGRRFLVLQHGMRVARATGIILLVLYIVFLLLIPYVETAMSTKERSAIDLTTIKVDTFDNIDDFDAEFAERIAIDVKGGPEVHYTLYYKDAETSTFVEKNASVVLSGTLGTIPINDYPRGEYKLELFIEDTGQGTESDVVYMVDRKVNPDLRTALTGLLLVIAIANLVWTVACYVLMRKYEVESVGGLADAEETAVEWR